MLTEDSSTKTGTVKVKEVVGKKVVNGILDLPSHVSNGEYTYAVTETADYSLQDAGISKITLPNTLRIIGKQSFLENTFEEIIIPEGVVTIKGQTLGRNDNLKKVVIPTTVKEIGGATFNNCNSDIVVYFNALDAQRLASDASTGTASFQGLNEGDLVICPDEAAYRKLKKNSGLFGEFMSYSGNWQLTYEINVEFFDRDGKKLNLNYPLKKLYNQDSTWEKINNKWVNQTNKTITQFPTLPDKKTLGYEANYWAINEMGFATIDKSGKISISNHSNGETLGAARFFTSNKLYAVEDIFKIETKTTNKVYDGKSALEVSFNRNVKDYLKDNGKPDFDKLSCWIYLKDKNMSWSDSIRWEYMTSNKVVFDVKNVADSGDYAIQFVFFDDQLTGDSLLWGTPSANYSESWDPIETTIKITPAPVKFNLASYKLAWKKQDNLPTLQPNKGDTAGTIVWEAGQTPKKGINKYKYIFTPEGSRGTKYADKTTNPLTMDNFDSTEIKGEIEINYYNAYTVTFKDKDGKVITTKEVEEGKNVLAPTPPRVTGYTFVGWSKSLNNVLSDMNIDAIYKKNEVITPKPNKPIVNENNKDNNTTDTTNKVEKVSSVKNNDEGIKVATKNKDKIFNKNTTVHLETASTTEREAAKQELKNVIKVFNVILKEDGIKVERTLDSKLLITLDAKKYKDYKDIKVYQKIKDGEYLELKTVINEDEIKFECDSLDTYVLTALKNESDVSQCSVCGLCSPFLGICLFIWAITIILVGVLVYYLYKKSKKED